MDFDVRLGLTPTDLALREQQIRRTAEYVELNPDDSPELRLLQGNFSSEIVSSRLFRGESTIIVKKEKIVDICRLLRDSAETSYNYLSDMTAVDCLNFMKEGDARFWVVYNLYSMSSFKRFRVKAEVDEDDCAIDTVESIWPNANWVEREIFDMFGIKFNNHSDLRRILMADDWIGHPLRKDYPMGGEEIEFSHNVRGK